MFVWQNKSQPEPKGKSPAENKEAVSEIQSGPIELILYSTSGDSEASINEQFINPAVKKFPNYKIKYVRSAKETGTTLPDLLVPYAVTIFPR